MLRDFCAVATASAVILCGAPAAVHAEPTEPDASEPTAPPRVHVVLVGRARNDPTLSGRICTLFDAQTGCDVETAAQLDSQAVLTPDLHETVCLWITLASDGRARVYVSAREREAARTRYLFRDIALESGLDEVGEETLAQIAHSSALALWEREQETSTGELVAELERDSPSPAPERTRSVPPPGKAAPQPRPPEPSPPSRPAGAQTRFDVGGQYTAYAAGGEGLHHEPGAFASVVYREQLRFTLSGAYVAPSSFDVAPARVTLRGASSELRTGYLVGRPHGVRLRFEAGAGALWIRWTASALYPAAAAPGRSRWRGYALGSIAVEVPVRPLWVGGRVELRVPTRRASYEVMADGQSVTKADAWLSPGAGLELGLPL
jgi:hypothetical protein